MHAGPQNPSYATPPLAHGWARLRQGLREESGQALVFVAVALSAIVGFAGLVIDVGQLRYAKAHLQAAADAAALAGALELSYCSAADCAAMQTAAQTALTENGLPGSTLQTPCTSSSGSGLALTVNNGPCAVASDPNYGNANYVEAVVSEAQPTYLARLLGINSMRIVARAEATSGNSPFCLETLGPSGVSFQDNGAKLTASCGVMVDSDSSPGLQANGATINATEIAVHGTYQDNGGSVNPTPISNAPALADPLKGTPSPIPATCPSNPSVLQIGSNTTLNPGTFCGGIAINGSYTATLNPGTYILEGLGLQLNGGTVAGNGVTFYLTGSDAQVQMNGAGMVNLVAPTTGTYAGILFYQNPSDTMTAQINGGAGSTFQGALYFPSAEVQLNGSNTAAYTIVDSNSVQINGGSFSLGSDYSSLPDGSPAKGVTAVLAE